MSSSRGEGGNHARTGGSDEGGGGDAGGLGPESGDAGLEVLTEVEFVRQSFVVVEAFDQVRPELLEE